MVTVILFALALVFELCGLGIGAVGYRRTWRAHARSEEFLGPMKTWPKRFGRFVIRLFGRGSQETRQRTGDELAIGVEEALSATAEWGPLPSIDDQDAFRNEIQRRFNVLLQEDRDIYQALGAEQQTRDAGDRTVHADLAPDIAQVRADTRDLAVGGIRLQFVGWLLLLAGVSLGSIVNIIDA
jgi:hypothetical protein